jgi:hypothetical protein
VIPTKRFALALAAAATISASSLPADAQIVYPYPPYGGRWDSSVRLEVTPRQAEVYVDGYYAGIVDEFDGVMQRLRVEPGQHEIAIYLDGYRTYRQRVYLARDRTFRIRARLEPLAPGEVGEGRPVPVAPPVAPRGVQPPRPLPGAAPSDRQPATGELSIHVQPVDAEVVIDGQAPWVASAGQETIVLDVAEGWHVIQVRKAGYIGYLTEVEVRRGETTTVTVNLRQQP